MSEAGRGGVSAASIAWLTTVRLLGIGLGFAVSVIGARALGEAGFGAAGVAITVGTVAALVCNPGVNIAVIYLTGRDPERRAPIMAATSLLALAGTLVAVGVVTLTAATAAPVLGLSGRPGLFAAAALVAVGTIGFEYVCALLLSLTRNAAVAWLELVRGLAALLLVAALLLAVPDATGFVVATGLAFVVAAALGVAALARGGVVPLPRWHADLASRALALGMRGQAGNVLAYVNLRLDLLLVPVLLDLPATGLYLVATRAAEVLGQLPGAVGSLLFPAVARQGDPSSTQLTERAVRLTVLLVALAALVVILVADPLLAIAFGSAYSPAATALRILAASMLPLAIGRVLAADLKGRGRAGLVSLAMLTAVAVTVVGDLLLIPRVGIAGAAITSLAAYATSAALLLAAFRVTAGGRLGLLIPRPADVVALLRATRAAFVAAR
jgi:O-antigen/teichoic acid export membrane protein